MAGDARRNLDFYTQTLGLRLVKRTINYDDPGTYHFYFGDETGSPGTILTFFPWPGARPGRVGAGQSTAIGLSVPFGALPFWRERLAALNIPVTDSTRFGANVLTLPDPDGLPIELIEAEDTRSGVSGGPVSAEYAVRGMHSLTLTLSRTEATHALLTDTLSLRETARDGNRTRYAAGDGGPGTMVDIVVDPHAPRGTGGVGTVHHIAWRTPDDDQQTGWHAELSRLDYPVSPVMDRQYFHSIYFREPGGVLFEIATDAPGFTTDEDAAHLGQGLMLPAWLEAQRTQIEQALPPLS